jgi:hypothetical protein
MEPFTYEKQLDGNLNWALNEGGRHFEYDSAVHKTLRRIAKRLDEIGVPYAVMGAMAMFAHGMRRFTEDVDILTTSDGLKLIQENLVGRGYRPTHEGSRHLRDTEFGVRVEFLISGQYPGDGRPKPVSFPDPKDAGVEIEGISYVDLHKLIELKLASGTVPGRRKDLGDVQEIIRVLALPRTFSSRLDASVRDQYDTLWDEVETMRQNPDRPDWDV